VKSQSELFDGAEKLCGANHHVGYRAREAGDHQVVDRIVPTVRKKLARRTGRFPYASALFLGLLAILAWGVQRRFPFPNST